MALEWFCTRAEVAAQLGIGEKRVNVLVRDGALTAHVAPGVVARLFSEAEVSSLAGSVNGVAVRPLFRLASTELTLAEAARTIGVTRKTLRDRAALGTVPAVRSARGWSFSAADVDRLAAEPSIRRIRRLRLDRKSVSVVGVGGGAGSHAAVD